jgi:diaminohydroxyphosphoribosylaminopyrimidine deaminase/5-amino-6-(5-phosphoribosylamino)uracil reductase
MYAKYITRGIPFVTLKAALSLDGKIAAASGDSRWISSPGTRDYVHLLRGEYDAVMIGINTVLRDDPLLSVRHQNWEGKKISRVILDSRLRIPLTARILATGAMGRIIVFAREGASAAKAKGLRGRGADVVYLRSPLRNGGLQEVLAELGKREIGGLIVEGGGRLQTSFIEAHLADKIILTLSPKLIGGRDAPGFFGGEGVARVRDALALKSLRPFSLGDDLILEGYF